LPLPATFIGRILGEGRKKMISYAYAAPSLTVLSL
jgi:hypothetical protein